MGGVVGDSSRGRCEREVEGKVSEKLRSTKNADNELGVWCGVVVGI
jgi:hypothetical protein